MKVQIRSRERSLSLSLPTRMLFSKGILKFGLIIGKRHSAAVPDIPPAAIDALCQEIRRIQKTHPNWELVHIHSADGKEIRVIL